jgi:hypothetical protein
MAASVPTDIGREDWVLKKQIEALEPRAAEVLICTKTALRG